MPKVVNSISEPGPSLSISAATSTSSKPAITKMAQTLAAYPENFSMEDPDVEMEVEVEVAEVPEVKAVISSVGDMKGANVNIKVVVVSGNSNTTMNF